MFSDVSQYVRDIIGGGWKIFSGAIGSGLVTAYQHGEVKDWTALFAVLSDAALPATVMVLIWLFMRSPKDSKEIKALRKENEKLRRATDTTTPVSPARARE